MRSVGGARVGLAACLVAGCASAWKPPPEPPPPTPFVEAPSRYDRGLDWDAKARRIGCGPADFTVPADLAARVQMNGPNELTIVPAGSPPGGALMARVHDPHDESERDDGLLAWVFKTLAEKVTLGNELMAMARLHVLASGLKPEQMPTRPDGGNQDSVKVTTNDEVVQITYDIGGETWRLVGIEGNRCVMMAIERVSPNATHHFDDIAQQMRVAAPGFKLRF